MAGRQARDLASHINRFQNDIHRCVGFIQDPKKLKEIITNIYATHVQDTFVRTSIVYVTLRHTRVITLHRVTRQQQF